MDIQKGYGAPTTSTFGNVGDYYIDLNTDTMYKCVDVNNDGLEQQFITIYDSHPDRTEYVWECYGLGFTEFRGFFLNGDRLSVLDRIDTSRCTDFSDMFGSCAKLTSIPELDTSNGIKFTKMFYMCIAITTIPKLDTSKGTNFHGMFNGCMKLETIPELDTSNGHNFSSMFTYCSGLTSIPRLDVSSATGNFAQMFTGCSKLTHLRLYNVKLALDLSNCTKLDVDSLVHTIKELHKVSNSTTLTLGSTNLAKISSLYCKVLDNTTDKIEMELCDSTTSGAITLSSYAGLKNWTLA